MLSIGDLIIIEPPRRELSKDGIHSVLDGKHHSSVSVMRIVVIKAKYSFEETCLVVGTKIHSVIW